MLCLGPDWGRRPHAKVPLCAFDVGKRQTVPMEVDLVEKAFSPLLPVGVHPADLASLKRLCVDYFPHSATRRKMLNSATQIIELIKRSSIPGRILIGGSFLTKKAEPDNFILVFIVTESIFDAMTRDQQSIFEWIRTASLFDEYRCGNYGIVIDESRGDGEWLSKYWLRQIM